MSRNTGWVPCGNLSLLVQLCELWNKERLYEILWEYACLSPSILIERGAKGWLYYEAGKLAGFALGRERLGWWHMEELWGPSTGSNGIDQPAQADDISRARRFGKIVQSLPGPILVRAAVDNPFANILAREAGAEWCGGFLLSKRNIRTERTVHAPNNCSLRRFEKGDEYHLSRIHRRNFDYPLTPEEYREWAQGPKRQTNVATVRGRPVGFIIAEKRPYNRIGDFKVAVDPSYHGRGIGSALLETALNDLHRMDVRTVIADFLLLNGPAQALYRAHGFRIARAYNYYKLKLPRQPA